MGGTVSQLSRVSSQKSGLLEQVAGDGKPHCILGGRAYSLSEGLLCVKELELVAKVSLVNTSADPAWLAEQSACLNLAFSQVSVDPQSRVELHW